MKLSFPFSRSTLCHVAILLPTPSPTSPVQMDMLKTTILPATPLLTFQSNYLSLSTRSTFCHITMQCIFPFCDNKYKAANKNGKHAGYLELTIRPQRCHCCVLLLVWIEQLGPNLSNKVSPAWISTKYNFVNLYSYLTDCLLLVIFDVVWSSNFILWRLKKGCIRGRHPSDSAYTRKIQWN